MTTLLELTGIATTVNIGVTIANKWLKNPNINTTKEKIIERATMLAIIIIPMMPLFLYMENRYAHTKPLQGLKIFGYEPGWIATYITLIILTSIIITNAQRIWVKRNDM